ncbi:MAG: 23S rRNA (guanosine(2251)-2'-O)-methyltransferase RlmB [Armatimonadota bacterium]|nr:MAG: 23S rRNA (guanosine(2251)-2'-O)-methyltransferase RlmB [Armatimonadota bacterium]
MIAGRNAVLMALRGGGGVREVNVDRGAHASAKMAAIADAAKAAGVRVRVVDRAELDRLGGSNHQGVVAIVAEGGEVKLKAVLDRCASEGRTPCLVLLRELLHEHNLGAILRTADAAGADAVLLPSHGGAELGSEAVRVSTGASETIPVVRQSLMQALAALRRKGVTIIGAEPEAEADYWDHDLTGAVAFVLGGEDRALSQPLRDACDALVRIPMVGHVTSLNVSVACALLLYERLRQMASRERR